MQTLNIFLSANLDFASKTVKTEIEEPFRNSEMSVSEQSGEILLTENTALRTSGADALILLVECPIPTSVARGRTALLAGFRTGFRTSAAA